MKIEKNIPMPESHRKYCWGDLEIGDSCFFDERAPSKAAASARIYAASHDVKFSARSIDGGTRVWRIK